MRGLIGVCAGLVLSLAVPVVAQAMPPARQGDLKIASRMSSIGVRIVVTDGRTCGIAQRIDAIGARTARRAADGGLRDRIEDRRDRREDVRDRVEDRRDRRENVRDRREDRRDRRR